MENKSEESVLSRMRLSIGGFRGRLRANQRGVGWFAHPWFLAILADIVLAGLLIFLSPGSNWNNLFGPPIGIHFSVLVALITLPAGVVLIKNWVGWLMLLIAAIAVVTFFLSHGVI